MQCKVCSLPLSRVPSVIPKLVACRALLVGEQTLGKGVVQYFFPGEKVFHACTEACTSINCDAASPPYSVRLTFVPAFLVPVHGDGGLKLTVSHQSFDGYPGITLPCCMHSGNILQPVSQVACDCRSPSIWGRRHTVGTSHERVCT